MYEAQIAAMLAKEDYQGAATLQARQALATGAAAAENQDEDNNDAGEDAPWPNNEDEEESSADEQAWPAADEETHTLKMLYQGNMEEVARQEEQSKKAKMFMRKHDV